jgi:hypothetical protein
MTMTQSLGMHPTCRLEERDGTELGRGRERERERGGGKGMEEEKETHLNELERVKEGSRE